MIILQSVQEMQQWSHEQTSTGKTVGLVPTMGALHAGHQFLIQRSVEENDFTVVSIFVNPTQFTKDADFETYPRTFDADMQIARSVHADVVFAPNASDMYPYGFSTMIEPGSTSHTLEGIFRSGHFRGVVTVVAKLFNAVMPTRAYFGQKDFQQFAVINQLVRDLNFSVQLVGVETVRDDNGLALSSRNALLSEEQRNDAAVIFLALRAVREKFQHGERDLEILQDSCSAILATCPECIVEYVNIVDADTFLEPDNEATQLVLCIAVTFGEVRLIDNVLLS